MQAVEVADAVVGAIVLATGRVIPFYAEPETGCTRESTVVADCAELGVEGETFVYVNVGGHGCGLMSGGG